MADWLIHQEITIRDTPKHLICRSNRYLVGFALLLFFFGLWPFNFTEKNNAVISPAGGLEIARHGTAYTAASVDKLQGLEQVAIHIDLETSSNGLNAFEKIFSHFVNQEEMNFLLGQWKDNLVLHLRTDKQIKGIKIGAEGVLKSGERTQCLITYDGAKLVLYQDGEVKRNRETGPLDFSNWDRTYPLVVGTDAGGRSQWKGRLYQIAMWDRALTSDEVMRLSSPSGLSGLSGHAAEKREKAKGEIAAGLKPLAMTERGAGAHNDTMTQDNRPLVHYVFKPEYTYETEFRGGKALGVRDLGKGEAADLVIPEQFVPYQRTYLGWDPDWTKRSTEWLDLGVNILGFIPFGVLLVIASKAKKCLSVKDKERRDCHGADAPRNDTADYVLAVILAVVVGFGVSCAIEYLQAYLPSRDSSLRDLITNVLGTAIGAIAAAWMVSRCSALATGDQ